MIKNVPKALFKRRARQGRSLRDVLLDGRYLVPIKASVREAEDLEEGDSVTLRLEVR
jgi:hypothetical protein